MASVPTTQLDAINTILSAVGESPITSTDYIADSVSATIANNVLNEVDRSFQSKGWSFNTENGGTLTRDTSNQVSVSSSVVRISFDYANPTLSGIQPVLRGNKIYDALGDTYTFAVNLPYVSRINFISFSDLPEPARNYIIVKASRLFLIRTRPEEVQIKVTEIDEQLAFATFLEYEVRANGNGPSSTWAKYSTELEDLGINQASFLASGADEKTKLVQLALVNLQERQGRIYYRDRVEKKTTAISDTYATYKDNFNRLGVTEKDFIQLDPILREELLVIAKNTTTTADTRATKFFQSTNASKASKLGLRYAEFLKLTREEQQLFLDGVASLSEDRFSRYVTNQTKALRIGVRITDFLQFKPEEQEIFLDALGSGSYSDTRAETYSTQKAKLDRLGINPPSFFALKPEEQANLLVAVADVNFADTRVSTYVSNQAKLKALGVYPTDFFALSYDQQTLVLDAVSSGTYTETRASDYVTNRDKLRKLNINAVDFFSLKPDQQNQLLSVVASASFDEARASSYITNQAKFKRIGVYPAEFFSLKPDQQYLLLETLTNASWSDTRATDYVTNQAKFKAMGVYPADFFTLKPDQQTLLLEALPTFTEDRASTWISSQNKLKALGLTPAEFFLLKPDQQNLILSTIGNASYTETRNTDFVTNKTFFDRIGLKVSDFFTLKYDQQVNILSSFANGYTDNRFSRFTAHQENFKRLGITLAEYVALPLDQQTIIWEALDSYTTKTGNVTLDAPWVDSNYNITGISGGTSNLAVGMAVSGTLIAVGSVITEILSSTSVRISKLPTGSGTGSSLTFQLIGNKNQYLLNGENLKNLIKTGINLAEFVTLNEKQQNQLFDLLPQFQDTSRYQAFIAKVDQFKIRGLSLKDFLQLKPSEQQNIVDSAGQIENSIQLSGVNTFNAEAYNRNLNDVLMMAGLNPVTGLNRDFANKANWIFTQNLKDIQAMGWHYNTDKVTLTKNQPTNGTNRIRLDDDVLAFDVDKYKYFDIDPVIRNYKNPPGTQANSTTPTDGNYVWDTLSSSYVSKELEASVVRNLSIESIPSEILKYIKVKTAKDLVSNIGSLNPNADSAPYARLYTALSVEEQKAKAEAMRVDGETGDYNIFDSYDVARVLDRTKGHSSLT